MPQSMVEKRYKVEKRKRQLKKFWEGAKKAARGTGRVAVKVAKGTGRGALVAGKGTVKAGLKTHRFVRATQAEFRETERRAGRVGGAKAFYKTQGILPKKIKKRKKRARTMSQRNPYMVQF